MVEKLRETSLYYQIIIMKDQIMFKTKKALHFFKNSGVNAI